MYNPRWFKEERLEVLQGEVERIGFGTLVTNGKSGLYATHIPMLIDPSKGKNGLLYGHIARGNSQWRETPAGSEALAVFLGPDAYITPRWYQETKKTGKVVPTWNYIAIHVRGPITFLQDEGRLREMVTLLTRRQESEAENPWEVESAPQDFIRGELRSIVGFEMPITKIEGKWKLSQNRSEEDREGAKKGLKKRGRPKDLAVLERMKERS
ncbi:MAG TPA: FMN-binding negative transcriptional regulator [Nitrososphaerales archaeon]|nr:FMN-binding negative transcriptional regulator [Nitrososphaerales archaeon]